MTGHEPADEEDELHTRTSIGGLTAIQRAGLLVQERDTGGSRSSSRSGALLLRVLVYMSEHAASRTTTVESIAAAHGVTRRYLERNFAKVGETPAAMLRSFRISIARGLLLREPPERISTVAERAGFGSVSAFVRAFHQETGETPAAWRRSRRLVVQGGPGREPADEAGAESF